jgi:hypothetical protein
MTCLGLGDKAGRMNILYMTSWYLTTFLKMMHPVAQPLRRTLAELGRLVAGDLLAIAQVVGQGLAPGGEGRRLLAIGVALAAQFANAGKARSRGLEFLIACPCGPPMRGRTLGHDTTSVFSFQE